MVASGLQTFIHKATKIKKNELAHEILVFIASASSEAQTSLRTFAARITQNMDVDEDSCQMFDL